MNVNIELHMINRIRIAANTSFNLMQFKTYVNLISVILRWILHIVLKWGNKPKIYKSQQPKKNEECENTCKKYHKWKILKQNVEKYSCENVFLNISLLFLKVPDFCKLDKKYLSLFVYVIRWYQFLQIFALNTFQNF